jgi:hypothetical protein
MSAWHAGGHDDEPGGQPLSVRPAPRNPVRPASVARRSAYTGPCGDAAIHLDRELDRRVGPRLPY